MRALPFQAHVGSAGSANSGAAHLGGVQESATYNAFG